MAKSTPILRISGRRRGTAISAPATTPIWSSLDEIKSFADFLDPKWKGKIAWSGTVIGAMLFITGVRNFMGEEKALAYLQQLAKQDIVSIASANRVVVDRVMAGEYALCLDAFLHHPIISARKGAPVAPLPLDPVLTVVSSVMLPKAPPHPYAAMLFIDYLLSKEGQARLQGADYFPAHPDVPASAGPRQDRAAQDRPEGELHRAGQDELGSAEVAGAVPGAFRQMTIAVARGGGRSSMSQSLLSAGDHPDRAALRRRHPALRVSRLFEPA